MDSGLGLFFIGCQTSPRLAPQVLLSAGSFLEVFLLMIPFPFPLRPTHLEF